jgi:phospholipid/cholesterol/gamma-HCH transport system substrate-binding protein
MNRNLFEMAVGTIALMISILFVSYVVRTGLWKHKTNLNFPLKAKFANIDGIKIGSDVKIGGLKVGKVTGIELNSKTFEVEVDLVVQDDLKIPTDSSLSVTSSGIFGSKYLAIKVGFEEEFFDKNDLFTSTQSSTNLEDLISKFATSSNSSSSIGGKK